MFRTVVVVPCYNEEARFRPEPFVAFCDAHPDVDFLLVDDGSTDRTASVLESAAAARPGRIGVLALQPNGGKAEAVRLGMLAALENSPDRVGFLDADLATPLEAIPEFVSTFEDRPEIEMVFGSRVKLLGRRIDRRAVRHYLGRVFATFASLALRLPIYDTQCGAKMFAATPRLAAWLETPFLTRWIFDVELLARALRDMRASGEDPEARIVELPLTEWTDVAGSKVRPGDFLKAAVELVRIRLKYRS
jgi:glycosyltransferase involved in cell wall biosynthesis